MCPCIHESVHPFIHASMHPCIHAQQTDTHTCTFTKTYTCMHTVHTLHTTRRDVTRRGAAQHGMAWHRAAQHGAERRGAPRHGKDVHGRFRPKSETFQLTELRSLANEAPLPTELSLPHNGDHRWNRNRPQPLKLTKLVFLINNS